MQRDLLEAGATIGFEDGRADPVGFVSIWWTWTRKDLNHFDLLGVLHTVIF